MVVRLPPIFPSEPMSSSWLAMLMFLPTEPDVYKRQSRARRGLGGLWQRPRYGVVRWRSSADWNADGVADDRHAAGGRDVAVV